MLDFIGMWEQAKQELEGMWASLDTTKSAAQASDAIKRYAGTPENANMVEAIEKSRSGAEPVVLAPAPAPIPEPTPVSQELDLFEDTAAEEEGIVPTEALSPLAPQGLTPPSVLNPPPVVEDPEEETEAVSVDMRGQSEVRGVRNNNPLNIEIGDDWDGLAEEALDTRFATFNDLEHGLRAGARILNTYRENHGVETLSDIIYRWAPPSENDTPTYVKNVAEWSGIPINVKLNAGNNGTTKALLKAMVRQENGKAAADALSDDVFDRALSIAFPE
tara:strand:+ start:7707 stop:8531 length:825 start_codon:yes stop_codon:yes gene_type:complete